MSASKPPCGMRAAADATLWESVRALGAACWNSHALQQLSGPRDVCVLQAGTADAW